MKGSLCRSEGTRPERLVQRAILSLGLRGWERNDKSLPGSPDISFPALKRVIFVHGCFWHVHPGCPGMRIPEKEETKEYWHEKLARNVIRDRECELALIELGWEILIVWECETSDFGELRRVIGKFLKVEVPRAGSRLRRPRRRGRRGTWRRQRVRRGA